MAWPIPWTLVDFFEATLWFRSRLPLTDEQYQQLVAFAHERGFWIAGVSQSAMIEQVWHSLDEALEKGVPFEEWKAEVQPVLASAWVGSLSAAQQPHRIETIFRNWTIGAYNKARWDQMAEPAIRRVRPYLAFDGVEDSRQSPICRECNDTVLPADHPWWDSHRPPLHHRCRSGIRSLTEEKARRMGLTDDPPSIGPDEGFGTAREWSGPDRRTVPQPIRPPPAP